MSTFLNILSRWSGIFIFLFCVLPFGAHAITLTQTKNDINSITTITFTPAAGLETTEYAIQIDDQTTNTTQYLKKNHHVGNAIVWQTYSVWLNEKKYIQIINLLPSHNYRIIVIARTEGETEEEVFQDISLVIKQRPRKPKGVTVITTTASSLTVAWVKQSVSTTSYNAQLRSVDVWKKSAWLRIKKIKKAEQTFSALNAGTDYAVRVRACNAVGCSHFTNWKSAATL